MKILSVLALALILITGCTVPPASEACLIVVKGKEIREESGNTLYIIKASPKLINENTNIERSAQEFTAVKGVYENIEAGKEYNVIFENTTGAIIQVVSSY